MGSNFVAVMLLLLVKDCEYFKCLVSGELAQKLSYLKFDIKQNWYTDIHCIKLIHCIIKFTVKSADVTHHAFWLQLVIPNYIFTWYYYCTITVSFKMLSLC